MISLFMTSTNKIINRLADRSILADRRRNFFIITTIALAAGLIMTLALYVYGGTYQIRKFYQGRLQAAVFIKELNQFTALSEDEDIEQKGLLVAPFKELQIAKDRLHVVYYDETAFQMYSHELTEGRLPEEKTEIAIPASYLEKQGMIPTLGQSVSLALGQNVPSEYTVCGLIRDEDANNSYEVVVSQEFLEAYFSGTEIPYAALIRMTESENMGTEELKQYILACLEPYGFDETDIAFSSSYFTTFDNASSNMLTTVGIGILIIIACAVVIYSLFYLSVTGKVKEYGRLRVVGITRKQMKRLVQKESRKLSLMSIPLGIVSGCIIGYLLLPGGWYWPNTIKFAVITALAMEITIRLSIRKPVKIATSVSPIEAVRLTTTTDVTKFGDTKKLKRKLTSYSLAKINFSRNRKRTVLTLFSLGFSGILLMCISTVMLSINYEAMAYRALKDHEFIISLSPTGDMFTPYVTVADNLQQNNPLNQDFVARLTEEVMLRDLVSVKSCTSNLFFPGDVNVVDQPYYEIVGLSREYLEDHQGALLSGTLDYDQLVEEHGIIIDDSAGMVRSFAHYEATVGDSVQIETDEGEKLPFEVMATVDWKDGLYEGYFIFVPEDLLHTLKINTTNFTSELLFNTGLENRRQADDIVYEISGDNPDLEVRGIYETASFYEQGLKEIKKAVYAIAVFIGIFALINLSNTLMTSLIARRQEFGVLRSIGMSDKQVSEMLRAEAFHYVLATMAVTLTIGTVLGYILCRTFSQIGLLGKLNYTFPLLPMLIFFAALVVIALGYSVLAIRYCEKRTLAEYVKGME